MVVVLRWIVFFIGFESLEIRLLHGKLPRLHGPILDCFFFMFRVQRHRVLSMVVRILVNRVRTSVLQTEETSSLLVPQCHIQFSIWFLPSREIASWNVHFWSFHSRRQSYWGSLQDGSLLSGPLVRMEKYSISLTRFLTIVKYSLIFSLLIVYSP